MRATTTSPGTDGPTSIVEGGPGADQIVGGDQPHRRDAPRRRRRRRHPRRQRQRSDLRRRRERHAGGELGRRHHQRRARDRTTSRATSVPNSISGDDTLVLGDGERDVGVCGLGADTVTGRLRRPVPRPGLRERLADRRRRPAGRPAARRRRRPIGGSAKLALAKPGKLSAGPASSRSRSPAPRRRAAAAPGGSASRCASPSAASSAELERGQRQLRARARGEQDREPQALEEARAARCGRPRSAS